MKTRLITASLLLTLCGFSQAKDDIVTIESTISGSQEQPKILVIVPWQKPESADTISSSEEKAEENPFLQPLERKSFMQKSNMLETLTRQEQEP